MDHVGLFYGDEVVDAVEGDAAVITDDASATVGVGESCDDVCLAGSAHLGGVDIEDALVVSFVVFGKDVMEGGVGGVAVGFECLLSHLDAAVGHEGAFEGFVGLEADDLF